MKMRHPSCQSAIMSTIPALKAPFGAQRHSQIFGRHLNFESATLALKRQIWQPWLKTERQLAYFESQLSARSSNSARR